MAERPERVDLSTPDIAGNNREALEELFPGVIADGALDATRLGELLDIEVTAPTDGRERFGLMWAGKHEAIRSLLAPSRATLVPDFESSVNFDTAQHVFIEGDNLEVLKLLQKAYNDKVKCIYIDPPYNTGHDFVYNDDFGDGLRGYLEFTGQIDEDGNRRSTATDVTGRRHSRWLSMMYPRIVLARNLLRQDGFMFISISDAEVHHLRSLCDEIFGAENRIETFVWQSIFRPSNMSKRVRRNAEYVLCYARDGSRDFELVERLQEPQGEASLTQNNNQERELTFPAGSIEVLSGDGKYPAGRIGAVELLSELRVEGGRNSAPATIRGRFKWSQEYLDEEIRKDVYLCIKTNSFIPYYRKDYKKTALRPTKILPRDIVGDVLQANAEVNPLVGEGVFDYPKPTSLVRTLMNMVGVSGEDIVLDFFAGSGTTSHAVLLANDEDGARRRSVSVNLPEPTDEESTAFKRGYSTVSQITQRRIVAAIDSGSLPDEVGLRVLRLAPSNFAHQQSDNGTLFDLAPRTLVDFEPDLDAVTAEIFLKEGVPLHWSPRRMVTDEHVFQLSDGLAVVAALDLSEDVVSSVIEQEPRVAVFLEDGFAGKDQLKVNAFTRAREHGITLKTV